MTKKLYKYAAIPVLIGVLILGFVWQNIARAASTPSLGAASTYGILAATYTNSGAASTTINGDVGFTVAPTVAPGGTHTNYGSGSPYIAAGADQSTAMTALNNETCTFTWTAAVELSADPLHGGTIGTYAPGVYCGNAAMAVSGPITLSGSGTYIFRSVGAFDTAAGAVVSLTGGASACDIFWTSLGATTLGAGTSFQGTLIDNAAVTVGANTTWTGRVLAFSGPVTTGASSTITVPTCSPPPATLHVIKQVVNNSGGSATVSSFSLHVKLAGADVTGSPQSGAGTPGTAYSLAAGTYAVSEVVNAGYAATFSGDCNSSGSVTLASGADKTCTITNDDIAALVPPLIHVTKVPSPLSLPSGPGLVTYTYMVSNPGTVAMTNVMLTDDKCTLANYVLGDTNSDFKLDTNETWTYQCSMLLMQTTTNTATATGQANSFTATDTSIVTVVVTSPDPMVPAGIVAPPDAVLPPDLK